jgi:O-antigen/teichoic acid export membrane protein
VGRHSKGRHRRVRRHRQWLSKGFWAVTDQALFALTNFAVTVLLARWLSLSDYGAFAVAFSVLLLMGTVHTALLTEPMLVLGPSRYQERIAAYVRRLATLHFALTSVMGLALLLVVGILTLLQPQFTAAITLAALALSAPAILFLWLVRRACYIESRPRLAAAASLLYALIVPAGMLLLTQIDMLTAASGLLSLGLSSLFVGSWLTFRLSRSGAEPTTTIPRHHVTRAHWAYGRWALGFGALSWVPSNAVVMALPLWHSLEDAGTLRVATTLMLPVLHVHGALGPLLMPALVRARFSAQLRSTAKLAGVLFVGLSMTYAPVVLIFGSQLAELLFGPKYSITGATLWLLAAIPLVTAVSAVSGAVLRALERLGRVLWTYVAATVMTLLVGLPLVFAYGVNGALASMLLAALTTAILGTHASWRLTSAPRRPDRRRTRRWPGGPASAGTRAPSSAPFVDSSDGTSDGSRDGAHARP